VNHGLLRLFRILRPVTGDILRFDGRAFVNDDLLGGLTAVLTGSAAWNIASLAANADEDLDVTVTGAAAGDPCFCGVSSLTAALGGAAAGTWEISCNASAADTVNVNVNNQTGTTLNPGDGTVRCVVFKVA
jgi:hypothetical protein